MRVGVSCVSTSRVSAQRAEAAHLEAYTSVACVDPSRAPHTPQKYKNCYKACYKHSLL